MPQSPETIVATIRRLRASVSQILDRKGMTLKTCGLNTKHDSLKAFDAQTGYWQDPPDVTSKPPRWIVHLRVEQGDLHAHIPAVPGADRLGYYNMASGDVGGVFVRIIPAIRRADGTHVLYHSWEWVLFFGFSRPLAGGTSSELLDGFGVETGVLHYKGEAQPYATAVLFSVCEPADEYTWGGEPEKITYAQATAAVRALLNVSPQRAATTTNQAD